MRVIEVAAGLVFREGRLLITRRRAHDTLGGLWEFPGGKREGSETWEACLIRELAEEVGIGVEVHRQVDSLIHHYPRIAVDLRFFACRWVQNEPRPLGCDALAWVQAEELAQYEFPEADARLLERLRTSWRSLDPG